MHESIAHALVLAAGLKDYEPVAAATITATCALLATGLSLLVDRGDKLRRGGYRTTAVKGRDEALHEALILRATSAESRLSIAETALDELRALMDRKMSENRRTLARRDALIYRLGYDPETGRPITRRKGQGE